MNKFIKMLCIFFTMCPVVLCAAGCTKAQGEGTEEKEVRGTKSLYPRPNGAWVGDVMPVGTEDSLELFYLYETDHNGSGYHPIHRLSTENLISYEDRGCAVNYGASSDSLDRAIGTGCVLTDKNGEWHCFYTGHNDCPEKHDGIKECVMHAVSSDGENWTKIPEDTFFPPESYSKADFRDPQVFWNEDDGCYWLLIAGRDDELGGVVARYTSADLKRWEITDPLFAPQKQYMLECPDYFKMGDKYYLVYSWDCVTYYAVSDSAYGPFYEPEDNVLDGTGFCFYAAKTTEYKGKRYLCGWVGRKAEKKDSGNYDWAGNLVIHELTTLGDGRLGVKAPEYFDDFFAEEKKVKAVNTSGNVKKAGKGYEFTPEDDTFSLIDIGKREPVMALEFDLTFAGTGYAGVGFGKGDDYSKYTALVMDAERQCAHYEGCILSRLRFADPYIKTDFSFEPGTKYHIELVMENEIIVTYVNGEKALSTRVYKSEEDSNLALYSYGGECRIENIEIKTP